MSKQIPKLTEQQTVAVATKLRSLKDALDAVKVALSHIDVAVNEKQLKSNEDLAALEDAFDVIRDAAKGEPLGVLVKKAEALMLAQLTDAVPSVTIKGAGKLTRSTSRKWSIAEPDVFIEWALDNGDLECFTQSVRHSWCDDYFADKKKPPPGLRFFDVEKLSFPKPRAAATQKTK